MLQAKTYHEELRSRLDEMGSLISSLEEEKNKLTNQMENLLSEELTKGIRIGSMMPAEFQTIINAAIDLKHDIMFGHEECIRNGKTSREQLLNAVEEFLETRYDLEDQETEKETASLYVWRGQSFLKNPAVDIENEPEMNRITGRFRELVRERKLTDQLTQAWNDARQPS